MISYFVNCKYVTVVKLSLSLTNRLINSNCADGVGIYISTGPNIWRIPFGFQLVPAGIMIFGLFTIRVGDGFRKFCQC